MNQNLLNVLVEAAAPILGVVMNTSHNIRS